MTSFSERLKDTIRESGAIGVDAFMALAVAHYYATRDPFGAEGDFTTAPEISQMFGEMIGAWSAERWIAMKRPDPFFLLECGPGRGVLMADILRATKNVAGFHTAAKIVLMETSPALIQKQKEALHGFAPSWIETLDDDLLRSSSYPVILVANEFLDALPIKQFQKTQDGWAERMIGLNGEGDFIFISANEGDILESSPVRENFVKDVCSLLKRRGGAALFVDYGHAQSGIGDTLQAVHRHKFVSVLEHIGDADITSHVDFAALRSVAREVGLRCDPVITQGNFLRGLGIEYRTAALMKNADERQKRDIQTALHRLISPEEMGDLFKVMVIDNVSDR